MKKCINGFTAPLVCLFLNQTIAMASSHREAPLISNDPLADNTDLYAFRSPCDSSKIMLIANYIPFEHPAGGPNWYSFGENIRYEIHVDNNKYTPGDDVIYRFTFAQVNEDPTTFFNIRLNKENLKTTYKLERSMDGGANFSVIIANGVVPPPNIGPRSIESGVGLGAASYDALMTDAIATASTGERVFAGPIDDPFFVDLGGAFDVGGFRKEPQARDGLAKFNCHSLVIEVPIATLQKDNKTELQTTSILDDDYIIAVWANASRQAVTTLDPDGGATTTSGNWVQVSRLGMPLTNEVIIPIGVKDQWNMMKPTGPNEGQFKGYFINPELALYMDDSKFGGAVPGLSDLRIQTNSLGAYDFRNGAPGLFPLKGSSAVAGTALDEAVFGDFLLPDDHSPRAVDLYPIFYSGIPNLPPYQLATGKGGNPLAAGKPFINNLIETNGDFLRLNMAVPATKRNDPDFSSLGLVKAAVLGLTDPRFNGDASLQFIPNMDGFPNGRRLEDDVTTIELQAVGGVVLAAIGLWYDDFDGVNPVSPQLINTISFNAGVTHNDTAFKTCFPFVQGPWRGFTGPGYEGPKSNDPLPVKLLGFSADKAGDKVLLRWQVTNEENNARYEVEHSIDGTKFTQVGNVKAAPGLTNNYQFTHGNPNVSQANFYRLKQVDNDGKFSYSPVRMVRFLTKGILTITPNPATNFIKVYSSQNAINVSIYDQGGRKVASQVLTSGMVQFNITNLPKGAYTVVADNNGQRVETKRIVKQ